MKCDLDAKIGYKNRPFNVYIGHIFTVNAVSNAHCKFSWRPFQVNASNWSACQLDTYSQTKFFACRFELIRDKNIV